MAIITTSTNLTGVSYTRAELLSINKGATLTVDATPAIRPGNVQALTGGILDVVNTSSTVPLVFDLDDMVYDLRFEGGSQLKFRGVPMSLGSGSGSYEVFDFTSSFGGVIRNLNVMYIEEGAGSGFYLPWPVFGEDPKFIGAVTPAEFLAGNTVAGRALFWHETNRTLRTGDGTNGAVIPAGCNRLIPNIYVSNRHLTNATRIFSLSTGGAPTGGNVNVEITNEAGTVLGNATIAFNATAAQVVTAMTAVTGAGTFTATGGPLGTAAVVLSIAGSFVTGFGTVPALRVSANNLTGGTAPTLAILENASSNMSLIDLSPGGSMYAEWTNFSDKIRITTDNYRSVVIKNCGHGSDTTQFPNSAGTLEIDGLGRTQSPFIGGSPTIDIGPNVLGASSVKRVNCLSRGTGALQFSNMPGLAALEDVIGGFIRAKASTGNRVINLISLPKGLIPKNITAIGAALQLTNLVEPIIDGYQYADGVGNVQDTANAQNCIVETNCNSVTVTNFAYAGPMRQRSQFISPGILSTNTVFSDIDIDGLGQVRGPISLGTVGHTQQNCIFRNLNNLSPLVDTTSSWLTKDAKLRKIFATYAVSEPTDAVDGSDFGEYDLVACSVNRLNKVYSGTNYVGGNFVDLGVTPTTGHLSFGPFSDGVGMETLAGSYNNGLGSIFLPLASDSTVATIPFAVHGITQFDNVYPRIQADIPGAATRVAFAIAPGIPTGGTWTASVYDANNTLLGTINTLASNINSATLTTALVGIAGVGTGVTVAGALTTGFTITWPTGQYRVLRVDGANLTGGTEPGFAYAVGRMRTLDGNETIGTDVTFEFAVRVPGAAWPAYQAISGANLNASIPSLTGYSAGGAGLEARLKVATTVNNPVTSINQVSFVTTVDPTLWSLTDATINLQGPNPTDVVKVVRAADSVVLYTFTGGGVKSFAVGANFNVPVYFRRELPDTTVLMRTLPNTQPIVFGDNGVVPLFYGAEVQLAQSSKVETISADVDAIDAFLQARLDVVLSTRASQASVTSLGSPMQAGAEANIADAVHSHVIEDGKTSEEITRIMAAAWAGKISGAGTGTEIIKGLDGTTDRIVSTVDEDGNRTDVVTNGA